MFALWRKRKKNVVSRGKVLFASALSDLQLALVLLFLQHCAGELHRNHVGKDDPTWHRECYCRLELEDPASFRPHREWHLGEARRKESERRESERSRFLAVSKECYCIPGFPVDHRKKQEKYKEEKEKTEKIRK